jgi:TetR/AcrR family acrAB operon transcriptional repressor
VGVVAALFIPLQGYWFDMARCTKEEALETRSRIIDAAENIFHKKGVAQTSLADIASAASLTRGAIYWHFKNKSDLFTAMCERIRLPMEAMVEASIDEREKDPLGQMRKLCVFILRDTVDNLQSRKVRDIVFHKCEFVDAADPIVLRQQECLLQAMTNIEKTMRNAVTQGQLPKDIDTRLAGIFFHAAADRCLPG